MFAKGCIFDTMTVQMKQTMKWSYGRSILLAAALSGLAWPESGEANQDVEKIVVAAEAQAAGTDLVPRDEHAEIKQLREAADAGDAESQFLLAKELSDPGGYLPEDLPLALKYFERAAESGHVKAQHNVGALLLRGVGGPPQPTAAIPWLKRAAEQGSVLSQDTLGMIYERGLGVQADGEAAVVWFQQAAEAGSATSQAYLGRIYLEGLAGVEKDEESARRWIWLAADQNHPWASNARGEMLEGGIGGDANVAEAVEWYRRSAEHGHAAGQANYGRVLWRGVGTEPELVRAYTWLHIASRFGDQEAPDQLEELAEQLSEEQIVEAKRLSTKLIAEALADPERKKNWQP